MSEQKLSKHERRKLKIEQRVQDKENLERTLEQKEKTNKMLTYGAVGLGVIILGFVGYLIFTAPPPASQNLDTAGLNFPLGQIHWHATPKIEICGETNDIPTPRAGQHLGASLLHTHEDAKIHVEGSVTDPQSITLGLFFDNIGVKFSETQIMGKTSGDTCPDGSVGSVKMLVNGSPNSEFRNYVIRDGATIEIKFE